ncbi:MAG: GumC family protein [candidate division WOR-3 bacterium]
MEDRKGIRLYWELFKKHWFMVSVIIALSVGASVIVSLMMKPVYQGRVRLRIDLARSTSVLKTAIGTPFFVADPFQTQVNLIRSRIIAERVVQRNGLNITIKEKPANARLRFRDCSFPDDFGGGTYLLVSEGESFRVEKAGSRVGEGIFGAPTIVENWVFTVDAEGFNPGEKATIQIISVQDVATSLLACVNVLMEGPTEIMAIMVTAETPQRAAMLANAYAREYSRFIMEMDKERSKIMRKFLEEQLADMRHELDSLGDLLAKMRKEYGIFEPTVQSQIILGTMGELEKERIETRTALDMLRRQYPEAYEKSKSILPDTGYAVREVDLITLKNERAKLASIYKPDHPSLKLLDSQIYNMEQSLMANRMALYERRSQEIERLYAKYASQLGDLPARVIEVERLAARVQAGEEVYSSLLRNLYEIRMNENQETGVVVMVDSALTNPYPIQPKKRFNAALGFLAGLLLSIIAIFILEALDVSTKSKKEIERLSKATCLAIIPRTTDSESSKALMDESFKLLALSLDYTSMEEQARTVSITSTTAGEGKSTVALGLAKALVGMGKGVLLIDGDMRKPRLHDLFAVPLAPGLSDLLAGKKSVEEVISAIDGLMLITGGTVPPDPAVLLTEKNLKKMLSDIAGKFDYIVIDSPPVLPVVDAVKIGGWVSGVIIVTRYGFTKKNEVAEAADRLRAGKANLLGVVFNDVPLEIKRYTGKYYQEKRKWGRIFRGKR